MRHSWDKRLQRGLTILLAAASSVLGAQAAHAQIFEAYCDGTIYRVTPEDMAQYAKSMQNVSKQVMVNGLTFNITYDDVENSTGAGFDDATLGADRQAALEDVLTYLAGLLNESGELDVVVRESTDLPGSTIGQGGTFYSDQVGFQGGSALERLRTGSKPFASLPEMRIVLDFVDATYYLGSDPLGIGITETDFRTLVLHEFTHALGFASLSNANGENGFVDEMGNPDPVPGAFTTYDSLMRLGSGGSGTALFANPTGVLGETFQGTPADLVSENLFFGGEQTSFQYLTDFSQDSAPLFAPTSFLQGSSLSHWDTGNIPGNGAVMEHTIPSGLTRREFPAFEAAALFDIGWENINVAEIPETPTGADDPFPDSTGGVPVGVPIALGIAAVVLAGAGARRVRRR